MSYLLPSGQHYWPDFYCPEIKQWIEGKGIIKPYHFKILAEFSKEKKEDIIIISKKQAYFIDYTNPSGSVDLVHLGFCKDCGNYYFESECGIYRCRKCGGRYDNNKEARFTCYKYNWATFDPLEGLDNLKMEVINGL